MVILLMNAVTVTSYLAMYIFSLRHYNNYYIQSAAYIHQTQSPIHMHVHCYVLTHPGHVIHVL